MCGRYVIISPPEALRRLFGYSEQPNFPPRNNIAPTQPVPVVIFDNGARHFRLVRWGLLPAWVKDPRQFSLLINARAETVLEKPAFKNAIKRRRCLVPKPTVIMNGKVQAKQNSLILSIRAIASQIGFAGLMETWLGPNGEELDTVAIVTTAASADLAVLHHRVPVTIGPDDFDHWLDCSNVDAEEATTLLTPPNKGVFTWHAVSTRVNYVANDDSQLILPISEAEIAAEMDKAKPAKKSAPRKPASAGDDGQGSLV